MREIKYRAWDEIEKQMITLQRPLAVNFEGDVVCEGQTGFQVCAALSLMQFTGLHDKHGREAFENDILSFEKIDYRPDRGDAPYELGKVTSHLTGWELVSLDGTEDFELPIVHNGSKWFFDAEIIGDIYENPELLK